MDDDNNQVNSLISAGSDIAGAAVGGALGFLAGGPVAAAGAGSLGVGVTRVLKDIATRILSSRETTRVGATAATAIAAIKEKLDLGGDLRSDGFFQPGTGERPLADEIFEGTLLAAKNTHEEKKTHYLGHLFSNIAFDPTCLSSEANYQIHVAESLTYTQFVLLNLFSLNGNPYRLRPNAYGPGAKIQYATIALLQAIHELCAQNLLIMQKDNEPNHTLVLGINLICPASLQLAVGGRRLHDLLALSKIPHGDIEFIAQWLR